MFGNIVLQVDGTDSGFYSCVAGNILGESVSSAYLEINSTTSLLAWNWLVVVAGTFLVIQYSHHITLSRHLRTL